MKQLTARRKFLNFQFLDGAPVNLQHSLLDGNYNEDPSYTFFLFLADVVQCSFNVISFSWLKEKNRKKVVVSHIRGSGYS